MAESRFINLTDYCLVEYMFEPVGSLNYLNDDVILLKSDYTNSYQIYNEDSSYTNTKNIRDLSATYIGNNNVAYLDSEKSPNYIDYDSSLTETVISGVNVVYDRVRFHFISGFNFEDFSALILSIQNNQNNGLKHVFANIIFSNDTMSSLLTFNPKPLFLSNSLYDRFIEFKVPSIKNINEEFAVALNPSTTFSALITPTDTGYTGFIQNSPINISISECSKKNILSTNVGEQYDTFVISDNYTASVSQTNEFDGVGAEVYESSAGDYIEYYLSWNGGFPEELISILNRKNPSDDWVIIHQLSVYEQIGSSFIESSRQVIFQEDNWDEPLTYRPILKNAGSAVSMSIDLLSRLTNKRTGEQIIREGSFAMLSPKKYGKKLMTIPLSDEPRSQRVYNKIVKNNFEATQLFIEPEFDPIANDPNLPISSTPVAVPKKVTEYVPVYFSNNHISISNSGTAKLKDDSEEVIFGPGKLRFIMSPYDNIIKLKLYNIVKSDAIPMDLNSSGASYNLNFQLDSGKISIKNAKSDKLENLSTGEVAFKISAKDSEEILKSKSRTVYLTSSSQEGTETLVYTGEWRKAIEQDEVDAKIKEAKSESDLIKQQEQRIKDLETKIRKLTLESRTNSFNMSDISKVKKKAAPPVVNRIGMTSPKKIKTNTSNAGFKLKKRRDDNVN